MLPHRNPERRVRRLSPFHLLHHLRIGLMHELSHPGQRLAPPVTQRRDARIDELGGRRVRLLLALRRSSSSWWLSIARRSRRRLGSAEGRNPTPGWHLRVLGYALRAASAIPCWVTR